jgi:hypothetical protein
MVSFLNLLGIKQEVLTVEGFVGRYGLAILASKEIQASLILSGEGLRALRSEVEKCNIPPASIGKEFTGSLIHSLDRSPACLQAIEDFFDGASVVAQKIPAEHCRYRISAKYPEICGALSGLSFEFSETGVDGGVDFEWRDGFADRVVSIDEVSVLTYARQGLRELFVASSGEILDIQESVSKAIDFRTCFSKVVPILIALRHLFRGSCWTPEAHYANIIIDDPPLWLRYGHLELAQLADLTDRTGCACTIAMIPWNYRRSHRRAVNLVATRQPRLGVCIHGCNHTGAEFGCQDRERLMTMLSTAKRRMDAHQRSTRFPHQSVMVFPQGVFSIEAMECLRSAGYLAAANTEVSDYWGQGHLTLRDLLQPAVCCYEGPPLFSRRRPDAGAINFAVDSFLGKPCLVVLHHDFFKGGVQKLEEVVEDLASFNPRLDWDNLENIVDHSAVSRRETDGRKTVRIFGDRAVIRASEQLTVIKRETDGNKIRSVNIDDESVDFWFEDGFLKWNLEPRTNGAVSTKIVTAESPIAHSTEDSLVEKTRIAVRRYLSEFRDNYPAQSGPFLRSARGIARSLRGRRNRCEESADGSRI